MYSNIAKIIAGITLISILALIIKQYYFSQPAKEQSSTSINSQTQTQQQPPKYYKCAGKEINNATLAGLTNIGFVRGDSADTSELYIPCGYNYIELELAKLKPSASVKYIYAIKGCDLLCSKNVLWSILRDKYGQTGAKDIMPLTWILNEPTDYKEFQRYYLQYKSQRPTFILKKNIQGKQGLYLTQDIDKITDLKSNDDYKVVQRYVDNVYTIQGYKLNIRLYVVITCYKGNIDWYLYNNGKCIYTNKKYDPDYSLMDTNLTDKEQHFTSLNLDTDEKYNKLHLPESLPDLRSYLGPDTFNQLWQNIISILEKIKQCYTGKLCMLDILDDQVCFQLFGIDIIINNQPEEEIIKPLLLEFNKGPEMIYKSPGDMSLKNGLITNMLELVMRKKGISEAGFTMIN